MDPVAFEIFGLSVRWYGIFMALAIMLGVFIVLKQGKKKGYTEDEIIDLVLVVVPTGIVGARIYYVLFNLDYYGSDILKMINLRGGGLAIHGAVLGGLLGGFIYCKKKKLNFLQLTDFVAPALILGQAIGRWGNFTNGEAHGGPTDLPWAIVVDGIKVHPTFLYESIWNLCIFLFLITIGKKIKKKHGDIFAMYFGLYSVGRFFIEDLRTDSLMFGNIQMARVMSLILIALSIYYIFIKKDKGNLNE
ncbi:MAG: prolipoprotein diacylglyceryl transferase [Bacillota bacterium]